MTATYLPNFSHLYVERAARTHPAAQRLFERFSRARIVAIDDYRSVFNRRGQAFREQKRSVKLILAVKQEPFIYPGSHYAPDFDQPNFCYNAMILNCIYDCEYCYLQGMYSSANIVVFVNTKPFFDAADKIRKERGSIYLCVSYDTDLLAFENIIPYCREWIEWAVDRPDALLEIRTKSANFRAIADLPAPSNVILAWTLSPHDVCLAHEQRTPRLAARLAAANDAIQRGWRVRLCIDPILQIRDWRAVYSALVDQIFGAVAAESVDDFSIGVFRMNQDYLDRIRRSRETSVLAHYPFANTKKMSTYAADVREDMLDHVKHRILSYAPAARVYCH